MISENCMNTDKEPMSVKRWPFLYEANKDISAKNSCGNEPGKWMMFHDKSVLDQKWAEARCLYNEGELTGIQSMKVSTAYENPRASDKSTGVIIFYCGPASDEGKMMDIGRKLLDKIEYRNRSGAMYYKSDAQTQVGTRATGATDNSKYKIAVPRQ